MVMLGILNWHCTRDFMWPFGTKVGCHDESIYDAFLLPNPNWLQNTKRHYPYWTISSPGIWLFNWSMSISSFTTASSPFGSTGTGRGKNGSTRGKTASRNSRCGAPFRQRIFSRNCWFLKLSTKHPRQIYSWPKPCSSLQPELHAIMA